MSLQLYTPTEGERAEIARLTDVYKTAVNSANEWNAHYNALSSFMSTVAMSNAAMGERSNRMDNYQTSNSWFNWRSWFSAIQISNNNISREAYINHCLDVKNIYIEAARKASIDLQAFQTILDDKNNALIELQTGVEIADSAVKAQELKLLQTQAITEHLPLIIAGVVLVLIIAGYVYYRVKK